MLVGTSVLIVIIGIFFFKMLHDLVAVSQKMVKVTKALADESCNCLDTSSKIIINKTLLSVYLLTRCI